MITTIIIIAAIVATFLFVKHNKNKAEKIEEAVKEAAETVKEEIKKKIKKK